MKKIVYAFLAILLSGCNFPSAGLGFATPDVTQAYGTIQALILTKRPGGASTTTAGTPIPPVDPTSSSLSGSTIPTLRQPSARPASNCDRISPGVPLDVTVQDDSTIFKGESFIKTWRLVNSGTCAWTTEYGIVFSYGTQLSTQTTYAMPAYVPVGSSIDISIEMTAPQDPGTYQSSWMLENPAGSHFGLGPNGTSPFYVRIIVPAEAATATPTTASQPDPVVLASGFTSLQNNTGLILSTKSAAGEDTADIMLKNGQVVPWNAAKISGSLGSLPDYATCASINKNETTIPVIPDNRYKYFCFTDSAGHTGWIQFLTTDSAQLDIELLTWGD